MLIGADINLARQQDRLAELLEYARQPGRHLYLTGKREVTLDFSVTNYCEKKNLHEKVSFFPYYDFCRNFPLLKKDCHVWLDNESLTKTGHFLRPCPGNPKRALFATMFHPMKNEGNSVVMRQWLEYLRRVGYTVHLLYYGLDLDDSRNKSSISPECFCDKVVTVPVKSLLTGRNNNGLNVHVDDWCGPEIIDAFRRMTTETAYDICFTNYAFFTAIFDYCPAYTEKVLLTHDSFLNRNRRFLAMGFPESAWMSLDASGEALACSRADKIIALQEAEAEYFRKIAPKTSRVFCIPPLPRAVDVAYDSSAREKLVVGYLGSSNWVNETNLGIFIQELAHHERLSKNIHLYIAGDVSKDIANFCGLENLAKIEHTCEQKIDSLHDFYKKCDIVINPERGGTGIKIKTLDALAHGAALLCTRDASVGVGAKNKFHDACNIPHMAQLLRNVIKKNDIVDELRKESRFLYDKLFIKYNAKMNSLLNTHSEIVCDGIPLVSEGRDLYFMDCFKALLGHTSIKGKTIIEFGSDENLVMAQLCAINGAKKVYACNPWMPRRNDDHGRDNLEIFRGDFSDCPLPPCSADLIFCIATLERLMDFESILQKILVLLKPEGHVLLQGEPFWTCGNGHHLWVPAGDTVRRGYFFNDRKSNPVPNWSHLVLTADAMRTLLSKTISEKSDVEAIVDNIYFSSTSNKKTPSSLLREMRKYFYFTEERSVDCELRNDFYRKAAEIFSEEDLSCSGLTLFGRPKRALKEEETQKGLVSIIVPCYNVRDYVGECLDSILAQREVNIEIVLVDDKSTDGTKDILDHYTVHHRNVVLCSHAHNMGLGPARNTGVKAASGKYLFFLDSDDYLASDTAIATLVAIAQKGSYSVVASHCRSLLPSGEEKDFDVALAEQWGGLPDRALSGEEAFKGAYLLEKGCFIPMRAWGILFEADFYARYDFSFPPGTHEDLALIPFIYFRAERVYYTSTVTIMYRQREGSLSNKAWSIASCVNAAMNWAVILENIQECSLERYRAAVAVSILGHHTYKAMVNSLEKSAIQDFFNTMQYIASSVMEKISQEQFDAIFMMLRALRGIAPSAEAYAGIGGYFHRENLTAFYLPDGNMHARPEMAIPVYSVKNSNREKLEKLFRAYHQEAPDSVKKYPAMLTEGDRAVYYYYASRYAGEGAVIDTGCFVGGTTSALVEGLKRNSAAKGRKVYVYDLFQVEEGYIRQWVKDIFGTAVSEENKTFRPFFDQLTAPFSHMLEVHEGDIRQIGYAEKEPIDILALDCCKTLHVTDSVIRNFFPYLVPGRSIVIHQDYIHVWHPYIHISMELLSEYFVPLLEVEWGGSYVWKCVKRITSEAIAEIFGTQADPVNGCFMWYHDAYERNDVLLQKKQRQLLFAVNRHYFGLTRAMYAKSVGRMELAMKIGRETLLQGGLQNPVSTEQDLLHALSLRDVTLPVAGTPSSGMTRSFADPGEAVTFYAAAIAHAEESGDISSARSRTAELALELETLQQKRSRLWRAGKFAMNQLECVRVFVKKIPPLYWAAKNIKRLFKTLLGRE